MYYKCQGYRHLAASCSTLVRITIIDVTPTEGTKSDSDVYIFEGEEDSGDKEPTNDDVGLNCINQLPSTHLSIIRCVPSQPADEDDWRKMLPSYIH